MDLWTVLCMKAHDGDSQADNFIQLIHHCGQTSLDDGNYVVTLKGRAIHQKEKYLLRSLGFTCRRRQRGINGTKYALPGRIWTSYVEAKRTLRTEWHEALQNRLAQKLKTLLIIPSVPPLYLTQTQRLFLVQKFVHNYMDDIGSVPFIRGLVGCLESQLYKNKLVDWKMDEYVLTQNGENPMMDYIQMLGDVIGMKLVGQKQDTQDTPSDDDDHYIVWRMNPDLSDHDLAAILQCFPKQTINQNFPLSSISRPDSMVSSSHFTRRWLLATFNGLTRFIHSVISKYIR